MSVSWFYTEILPAPSDMAQPSELDRLNSNVKEYLRLGVLPLVTEDERLKYRKRYLKRIKFRMNWFTPDKLVLLDDVDEGSANILDAIIAQALFGREEMMDYFWFASIHEKHGSRLDGFPREPHPEFKELQASVYGQTGSCEPPQDRTTTTTTTEKSGCSTADLLTSLHSKIEEINASEAKQHKELEDIFSGFAKSYPGLRGLLCGVRHSFKDRDDRFAERKALLSATMEYVEEVGNDISS